MSTYDGTSFGSGQTQRTIGAYQRLDIGDKLRIRPVSGVEWMVQNIYKEGKCKYHKVASSFENTFHEDEFDVADWDSGLTFRATNDCWLEIESSSDSDDQDTVWDGIVV